MSHRFLLSTQNRLTQTGKNAECTSAFDRREAMYTFLIYPFKQVYFSCDSHHSICTLLLPTSDYLWGPGTTKNQFGCTVTYFYGPQWPLESFQWCFLPSAEQGLFACFRSVLVKRMSCSAEEGASPPQLKRLKVEQERKGLCPLQFRSD